MSELSFAAGPFTITAKLNETGTSGQVEVTLNGKQAVAISMVDERPDLPEDPTVLVYVSSDGLRWEFNEPDEDEGEPAIVVRENRPEEVNPDVQP